MAISSLRLLALANRVVEQRPIHQQRRSVKDGFHNHLLGRGLRSLRSSQQLRRRRQARGLPAYGLLRGAPSARKLVGPTGFRLDLQRGLCHSRRAAHLLGHPRGSNLAVRCKGRPRIPGVLGGAGNRPYSGTVGVFFTALVMHLLVILVVGSGHSGFGATFRIVCYSSVTSLLGWLPFIGWIFSLYRLYLATVGIREMHATTTGRALLVVLLPAILVLVLVLVVVGASAIVYFRAA